MPEGGRFVGVYLDIDADNATSSPSWFFEFAVESEGVAADEDTGDNGVVAGGDGTEGEGEAVDGTEGDGTEGDGTEDSGAVDPAAVGATGDVEDGDDSTRHSCGRSEAASILLSASAAFAMTYTLI